MINLSETNYECWTVLAVSLLLAGSLKAHRPTVASLASFCYTLLRQTGCEG